LGLNIYNFQTNTTYWLESETVGEVSLDGAVILEGWYVRCGGERWIEWLKLQVYCSVEYLVRILRTWPSMRDVEIPYCWVTQILVASSPWRQNFLRCRLVSIVQVIQSRRMSWAGHVTRMG